MYSYSTSDCRLHQSNRKSKAEYLCLLRISVGYFSPELRYLLFRSEYFEFPSNQESSRLWKSRILPLIQHHVFDTKLPLAPRILAPMLHRIHCPAIAIVSTPAAWISLSSWRLTNTQAGALVLFTRLKQKGRCLTISMPLIMVINGTYGSFLVQKWDISKYL